MFKRKIAQTEKSPDENMRDEKMHYEETRNEKTHDEEMRNEKCIRRNVPRKIESTRQFALGLTVICCKELI